MSPAMRRDDRNTTHHNATQEERMDLKELIAAAVAKEAAAHDLYAGTAENAEDPAVKALLTELAGDEAAHRKMLEGLDVESLGSFAPEAPRDLGLAEYMEDRPLSAQAGLQEAMLYATHREQEARDFYAGMASSVGDPAAAGLFQKLATMEAGHKARLEALYEDMFLGEN
jgi:rubrerythrin